MNNNVKLRTEHGEDFEVPEDGSLGLLALGYVGLLLWREKRQAVVNNRNQVNNQASDALSADRQA